MKNDGSCACLPNCQAGYRCGSSAAALEVDHVERKHA